MPYKVIIILFAIITCVNLSSAMSSLTLATLSLLVFLERVGYTLLDIHKAIVIIYYKTLFNLYNFLNNTYYDQSIKNCNSPSRPVLILLTLVFFFIHVLFFKTLHILHNSIY